MNTTSIRTSAIALVLAAGSAAAQTVPNEAPDFASCSALRPNRYEPGPSGAGERRPDRAGAPVSTDLAAQPTTTWCDVYYVQAGQRRNMPNVILARPGDQVLIQRPVETPVAQPASRVITRDREARRIGNEALTVATDARTRATAALTGLAELTQQTSRVVGELRQGLANEATARETADRALAARDEALQAAITLESQEREATDGALIASLRQQAAALQTLVETVNALRRANRIEIGIVGRGDAHAAGANAGSGNLCVAWSHRLTPGASIRTRGCYGLASQTETPNAGVLHNGIVSLDGVLGTGVARAIVGLGGSMRGNDRVGLTGWSAEARAGLRIQAAESVAFDLVGVAGVGSTHGATSQGQPLHSGAGFNGGGEAAIVWTP